MFNNLVSLLVVFVMIGGWEEVNGNPFVQYTQGLIKNPTSTTVVRTEFECAALCRKQLVCSAFSVRRNPLEQNLECRLSLGEFEWLPDISGSLYADYIGDLREYHLASDGYLYKLFTDVQGTLVSARSLCMDIEQGNLAVPYPALKLQAALSTPGVLNSNHTFFWGAYRTSNISIDRWITDDGIIFDSSNTSFDLDQKWAGLLFPWGNTMHQTENELWENAIWSFNATACLCRRQIVRYTRSTVNGAYYRASTMALSNAAAQADCEADGGALANIVTELDLQATEPFRTRQFCSIMGYAIAGDDNGQEGIWVFPNGTVLNVVNRAIDPFQRSFFNPDEPSNDTTKNCLVLGFTGATSVPCAGPGGIRRFLCQITLA